MDIRIMEALNQASAISNVGSYGRTGNINQTSRSFGSIFQNHLVNQMKQEIYNRFQIMVGGYSDTFSCYIPTDVLSRMNFDETLKEKVFHLLEKYSGEEFKESVMGKESSANKCTLMFNEDGDMTATLETAPEKKKQSIQSAYLLYQKYIMQQAALMPSQMNLYSVYNNLYGLNGISNFDMLQNPLFSFIQGL